MRISVKLFMTPPECANVSNQIPRVLVQMLTNDKIYFESNHIYTLMIKSKKDFAQKCASDMKINRMSF